MPIKVRKQIYIEPQQEALLKQRARETGCSEAALIRHAIDRGLLRPPARPLNPEAWNWIRDYIEDLIRQGPVPGGRKWRREDAYER